MVKKVPGFAMILFLVLMPLCITLAYNLYHATIYHTRTVNNIQTRRIERALTEALLHVGCVLCSSNKTMLMAWGNSQARTMHLSFPSWPTENKSSEPSLYAGTVSITSEKGILTLFCALTHTGKPCMSGQCTLVRQNPKNPASPIQLKNWSIT